MEVKPNAFIIGVQKAGTTSLHYWLAEHPDIYAPIDLKDIDFFSESEKVKQRAELFADVMSKHGNESVILLSSVNYCYYPSSISNIAALYPDARLIILLRNPVDRAISAYRYYHKLQMEKRNIADAFNYEWDRDSAYIFSNDNNAFTYIERGLYANQIKNLYKLFPSSQILPIDFDLLENDPKSALKKIYRFLGVDETFFPSLEKKNVTGKTRFGVVQYLVKANPVRKRIVRNFIKPWMPLSKRRAIKSKVTEWNTVKKAVVHRSDEELEVIEKLKNIYKNDVSELDLLLKTDYKTKWKIY